MNIFLIIDGLNLVRRIYAALPNNTDMPTLYQRVTAACEKQRRLHQPTHMAIVWDGDEISWRKQLYPDYKKGRKPMPDPLANGLLGLQTHLAKAHIASVYAASEADDVIATLAMKTIQAQGNVIIVSTDKGFCQLHHPRMTLWDHFKQQPFDIAALEYKLGVDRTQFIDQIALAGDSGNKIPGIAGIGPKAAAELLKTFRNLSTLFASLPNLGAKQAQKLADGKDMAKLSYKLAKLQTDQILDLNLSQFRVHDTESKIQNDPFHKIVHLRVID